MCLYIIDIRYVIHSSAKGKKHELYQPVNPWKSALLGTVKFIIGLTMC